MNDLKDVSLMLSNYKCFGGDEYGYERILHVNLIIDRNEHGNHGRFGKEWIGKPIVLEVTYASVEGQIGHALERGDGESAAARVRGWSLVSRAIFTLAAAASKQAIRLVSV